MSGIFWGCPAGDDFDQEGRGEVSSSVVTGHQKCGVTITVV
jgi:hypothetical protein